MLDHNGVHDEELIPVKFSNLSKKIHPVWKFFVSISPTYKDYAKNKFVCLLCREDEINKVVKVGLKIPSPTPLLNHIRNCHPHKSEELLVLKIRKQQAVQSPITNHLTSKVDVKATFKKNYTKWLVEESKPFVIGSSPAFQKMIKSLNPKAVVPDKNEVILDLDLKMLKTKEKMKAMVGNSFYSLTTDHWTSVSNDNYGTLTLHFINDEFKLQHFVLSFEKHRGGCSGEELQQQLYDSISTFPLPMNKLAVIVADSAANMNRYGELVMRDHSHLRHHYCVDHILHLTASKCYSTDTVVAAVKALKALVTFVNNSPQTNDKLFDAQKRVNLQKKPVKLLTDVKTRWWSTHVMIERGIRLRPALETMFRLEVVARQQSGKAVPSKLEQLELTDNHFHSLQFLEQVLSPFREAQRALEGDKYINISLVVLIIKKLYQAITAMLAAATDDEPELYQLLSEMVEDFEERWGDPICYSSNIVRASFNRQLGIPAYAYWAAILDPRTKKSTLKILSPQEKRQIWKDIQAEIMLIAEHEMPHDEEVVNNNGNIVVDLVEQPARRRGAAMFINNNTFEEVEPENEPALTVEARVSTELALYEQSVGCPLNDQNGNYYCPLVWWEKNHSTFPFVWSLARKILSIPATSAPAERVFSAASNVIDKKRARLKPQNADLLLFLRGNRTIVDWDA
jgi:hypothetical protein